MLWLIIAVLIIIADQAVKYLVVSAMKDPIRVKLPDQG